MKKYTLFVLIFAFVIPGLRANRQTQQPINLSQTMASDSLIKRYVAYNKWANQQLANWLENATPEAMNQPIESSFNTLRKTVIHIWNAEYLWLRVLQNLDIDPIPGNTFTGNNQELLTAWLNASTEFLTYVEQLDEKEINSSRSGSNPDNPMAVLDIVQHTMNHSTYHRGQLITMGRQAGLSSPPRTDFIYYVRMRDKQ
jgi:uncharacterized damage-inducible protein DinB